MTEDPSRYIHSGYKWTTTSGGAAGWILVVGSILLGAFMAGRWTAPDPPPRHREVEVPEVAITEPEPRVEPTIIERIVERRVEPRQVATAPSGGEADVRAFCAASAAALAASRPAELAPALPGAPPPPQPEPVLLVRSSRTSPGWWWQRDRTVLVGPLSDGRLREVELRHYPGHEWRVDGDSVVARESRFGWLRGVAEVGIPLATGVGLCYALGCQQ